MMFSGEVFSNKMPAPNDSIGLNNSAFSAFVDYDATSDFSSIEEELVENLNYQITQDVFDKISVSYTHLTLPTTPYV